MAKNLEVLTTIPFPESVMQKLREVNPHIRLTMHPAQKVEDIPNELWNRVEVLYTDLLMPDPAWVPNLHWIQYHYAGIDFIHNSPLLNKPDCAITTMSGASSIQESEYILSMMLALSHKLPDLMQNQRKAEWPVDRWERFTPTELTGSTVGLVGYGSIARELARLLIPFNVTLLAAKRDVMHPEDTGYTIEGHGDPEGNYFHRLYPIQALKSMTSECNFVVVTLPFTPETKGLIGEAELRAMKPGTFLIVVSRGGIVDEAALHKVLEEKHLGGAVLDVFSQEPLPSENPLWKSANVIITPHVSGFSPLYKERAGLMFAENLRRYLHGEPLLNKYEVGRSY
ncbi:MAG: D-2-hydroxyacid dehydrogenase [Anaerolineaceae bacterium]|nr:D-2-hydroxyacid dehydrogenase [Anaerolineaceae bacterium]